MKKMKIKKKTETKSKRKIHFSTKPIVIILCILLFLANIHILRTIAIFKNIETPLRICVSLLLIDIVAIFTTCGFKLFRSNNKKTLAIFGVILLLYCSGIFFTSTTVKGFYKDIASISESSDNANIHSSSLVVKKESPITDIKSAQNRIIGIVKEEGNIALYELPMKIVESQKINSNKIKYYDNHVDLIEALLNNEVEAVFLPTNYTVLYASDEFETLEEDTKIIYSEEYKEEVKEEEEVPQKSLDEPFSILVMGVDTTGDGIGSSFNGDALMLITFNPKTMNATILSIPRDSYMPISCMSGRKNKITNAGWQGESCIIKSIENYFGIPIDYYLKINFNGVVSVIDAIGGVDVDVPYSFCEQNSKRQWGKNTIFVKAGNQHLNGEQALAYARHRKVTAYMRNYCGSEYVQNAGYWNDFVRGQHQQEVLKAVLSSLADNSSLDTVKSLLSTISKNAKTSMSEDTILSLYSLGKKVLTQSNGKNQMLNMQRLYLSGADRYIYDYSFKHERGTRRNLYNFVIYEESYNEVVDAMKTNLEMKKIEVVKSFSFSIHNPYEEKIIGKKSSGTVDVVLMPNFVGKNIEAVRTWANQNDIEIVVNEVKGTSANTIGQVLKQDIPELTDLDMVNHVTFTVVSEIEEVPPVEEDPTPEEPGDNDEGEENPTEPEIPGLPEEENA